MVDATPNLPFPVIGVGASAGGLEALQQFFGGIPDDLDAAFLVIQHLSPDFKSMMQELLSRHARLPVVTATDGMEVRPRNIYLLPPRNDLRIGDGAIHLDARATEGGLHLPVDTFFDSLAKEQRTLAVAVVLSGSGSDGSRGVQSVKDAGGVVMVQDPDTAGFDGMPRAAIATGRADWVEAPRVLADQLVAYLTDPLDDQGLEQAERRALMELLRRIRARTGVTLAEHYKPGTLMRRLNRRLQLDDLTSIQELVERVRDDEQALDSLFSEFLIGVTHFFRDGRVWAWLEKEGLPELVQKAEPGQPIRIWVPACSVGAEAYTVAMLCEEVARALAYSVDFRIFATDVHPHAIARASSGQYTDEDVQGVPPPMRERYLENLGGVWHVRRPIRERITFAVHNLLVDPPFTRMDLVSCRNLLIYLRPAAQERVLKRLHFALKEGGVVVLGNSESVPPDTPAFIPAGRGVPIWRTVGPSPRVLHAEDYPRVHRRPHATPRRGTDYRHAAVEAFVPPGVVVDSNLDVLHVFGRAGDYLRLADGNLDRNLLRMVPQSAGLMLSAAVRRALRGNDDTRVTGLQLHGDDPISLRVIPRAGEGFAMVFFEPPMQATASPVDVQGLDEATHKRLQELEAELAITQLNLRGAVQDLETSNEELQATNEELVASNEELQSTNEELQSVNEELHTVNAEYQRKITELEDLNEDVEGLLRAVDVGVVFVDTQLRIRRFDGQVTQLLPMKHQDLGRPITDIALRANYPEFVHDVRAAVEGATVSPRRVRDQDQRTWEIAVKHVPRLRAGHGALVTFKETAFSSDEAMDLLRFNSQVQDYVATRHQGSACVVAVDPSTQFCVFSPLARRRWFPRAQTMDGLDKVLDTLTEDDVSSLLDAMLGVEVNTLNRIDGRSMPLSTTRPPVEGRDLILLDFGVV